MRKTAEVWLAAPRGTLAGASSVQVLAGGGVAVASVAGVMVQRYLRSRDPGEPPAPGVGAKMQEGLAVLSALPPNEWARACREMLLAALEAYAADSLAPIDDMVGGWLATAEVWEDPEVAWELATALGRTLEVGASWNSGSSRIVAPIGLRTRDAGSPATASISLRT